LHGYDIRPQETKRGMIGHSRVLSGELRSFTKSHLVARELLMKAALRLRREGLTTSAFGFHIRLNSGNRFGDEAHFQPTQDSLLLLQQLEKIWQKLMPFIKGELVAKVSLFFFHLAPIEQRMGDLFTPTKQLAGGEKSKTELLWDKIDGLNRKHGKNTVRLASQDKLNLAYLGAKIAFSRVPEKDDFNMMG
jgi:DNA polymerase-4